MIVVVMGGTCSGKTVFAMDCVKLGFKRVITNTTRSRRVDDKEDAYNFVTVNEFKKKTEQNEVIEYAVYNGNYYGTSTDSLSENCVIVLEPNGYRALKQKFPDRVVGVLLDVSDEERLRRGLLRGDSEEVIKERIIEDKKLFNDELRNSVEYIFEDLTPDENCTVIEANMPKWWSLRGV